MFIDPRIAIEEGWIEIPPTANMDVVVQPNAIDFDVDRVFEHNTECNFFIGADNYKENIPSCEQTPRPIKYHDIERQIFTIPSHGKLDCMSSYYVNIPEGVSALLVVRSTLNRNGIFLTSGLYDQGYNNYLGFCLHNRHDTEAMIEVGTRVGQIIFIKSETSGKLYSGTYNSTQRGDHWSE